eukprot:TRINITY_DN1172_c0_g1_i1.p1 TRINITY_DN1172_c0_g1~~TRINITY_DN1172_c0_g1_i1.p1  ORF type:complete len:377 (+),score=130.98 TRINITY_DN1172_c0_g1_i1:26-1156(+)
MSVSKSVHSRVLFELDEANERINELVERNEKLDNLVVTLKQSLIECRENYYQLENEMQNIIDDKFTEEKEIAKLVETYKQSVPISHKNSTAIHPRMVEKHFKQIVKLYENENKNLSRELSNVKDLNEKLLKLLMFEENSALSVFKNKGNPILDEESLKEIFIETGNSYVPKKIENLIEELKLTQNENIRLQQTLVESIEINENQKNKFDKEKYLFEQEIKELKEQLENLMAEKDSLPTLSEYAKVSQKNKELEDQIEDLLRKDEPLIDFQPVFAHDDTTIEAIRRDKEIHELGLSIVLSLPENLVRNILVDACRVLKIKHPTLLINSLEKLLTVIEIISDLEEWGRNVCELTHSNNDPSQALFVIKTWKDMFDLVE